MLAPDMRTVCLLGSPRRGCNSDRLADRFAQRATLRGAPVEKIALSELSYSGCRNLFRCKQDLDRCAQKDDLTPVLESVFHAQVLVIASPVYFTSLTGQMKLALDRFFSFFVPDYPTATVKSRLTPGRHLVVLQTQGEPEQRYGDLMESFSASFTGLGYRHHHLVRACGVREPGDVGPDSDVMSRCDAVADDVYRQASDGLIR